MDLGHDVRMDHDWTRLGKALRAARNALPDELTQEQLAEALGVGRSVIQLIEGGNEYKKPTSTIRQYAQYVGWADGSIERVLAGGEPVMRGAVEEKPAPAPVVDPALPRRIVHELKEGDLLDTAVIPLGDGANMVVVVKGRPGASEEEIRRDLEAWREAQDQLQELDYRRTATRPGSKDA